MLSAAKKEHYSWTSKVDDSEVDDEIERNGSLSPPSPILSSWPKINAREERGHSQVQFLHLKDSWTFDVSIE